MVLEFKQGFCLASFIPPRDERHPIIKIQTKTKNNEFININPICVKCAESENAFDENNLDPEACQHTDEEREITAHVTFEEVKLALEQNYQITAVSEVLFWTKEKLKSNTFEKILNVYGRLKITSSPLPENVTADKLGEYCQMLSEDTGFEISPEDINPSGSLKTFCKVFFFL